jgi:hypothetical protein
MESGAALSWVPQAVSHIDISSQPLVRTPLRVRKDEMQSPGCPRITSRKEAFSLRLASRRQSKSQNWGTTFHKDLAYDCRSFVGQVCSSGQSWARLVADQGCSSFLFISIFTVSPARVPGRSGPSERERETETTVWVCGRPWDSLFRRLLFSVFGVDESWLQLDTFRLRVFLNT